MTPKERAKKSAAAMWANDSASIWLGMELIDVDEGGATLSLKVQKHHTNGHGICHGGITFALADSAFAFACNSRNQATVAQHNVISYTASAKINETLTATATEVSLSGRNGIYDVKVTDSTGKTVAEFRGFSRTIKGQHFQE
ncbi:MAG: phenylacetic acid degradation protein PaaD [Rhodobacteraceae bacterium]|nr:MAG: phenylacetic acid degradation protein PaaD [Paracoccaceae bacterium]